MPKSKLSARALGPQDRASCVTCNAAADFCEYSRHAGGISFFYYCAACWEKPAANGGPSAAVRSGLSARDLRPEPYGIGVDGPEHGQGIDAPWFDEMPAPASELPPAPPAKLNASELNIVPLDERAPFAVGPNWCYRCSLPLVGMHGTGCNNCRCASPQLEPKR